MLMQHIHSLQQRIICPLQVRCDWRLHFSRTSQLELSANSAVGFKQSRAAYKLSRVSSSVLLSCYRPSLTSLFSLRSHPTTHHTHRRTSHRSPLFVEPSIEPRLATSPETCSPPSRLSSSSHCLSRALPSMSWRQDSEVLSCKAIRSIRFLSREISSPSPITSSSRSRR